MLNRKLMSLSEKELLNRKLMSLSEYVIKTSMFIDSGVLSNGCNIYHYTSPEGILGILQKEKIVLRFSHADYLNDITEGSDVVYQYKKVCSTLQSKGEISQEFYDYIKDVLPSNRRLFPKNPEHTDKPTVYAPYEYDTYLCCFSSNGDSLPMWNYYVKGNSYQGYNLKLSGNIGDDWLSGIYRVIYDDQEKERLIGDFVKTMYEKKEEAKSIYTILEYIAGFLDGYRYIFKANHFKHEQEVRMLIYQKRDESGNLKFRTSNGLIVPYIEKYFDKSRLLGVTVGPLMEQNTAISTMRRFLSEMGYRAIIKKSGAPIRY